MKAITIEQLEKRFQSPIPRNIKNEIKKWINNEIAQQWIQKAWNYEISDEDARKIFEIGSQKAKMPRLYWLCCIYIHPLTPMQALGKKVEKLHNSL